MSHSTRHEQARGYQNGCWRLQSIKVLPLHMLIEEKLYKTFINQKRGEMWAQPRCKNLTRFFTLIESAKDNSIEDGCLLCSTFVKYTTSYMGIWLLFKLRAYSIRRRPTTRSPITEKGVPTRAVNVGPKAWCTEKDSSNIALMISKPINWWKDILIPTYGHIF